MDYQTLQARLAGRAELIIGNVADTCARWTPRADAPIGMISFDLDLYSATMSAFSLLEQENVLPRIWCYFDDVIDIPESCLTDFLGEAAAIAEFNRMPRRESLLDNISQARVFAGRAHEIWHDKIYVYHRFAHPQYNANAYVRGGAHQLALR